jgi:tetratricopeptide (TPR) repeat protein
MPLQRESFLVLEELKDGAAAFSLWRILTDLNVWVASNGEAELFRGEWSHLAIPEPITSAVEALRAVWGPPLVPDANRLAVACSTVWEWAEGEGLGEVALQFGDLAARLEPHSAARASTAGRLCRRQSECVRGTMWFRRASRLARLQHAELDFAIARLGWGNLEADLGRFSHAEVHAVKAYRAALRVGRRSLAASAYHDLLTIKIHTESFEQASAFARDAAAFYRADHPRFPAFAHDVAYLWSRQGFYSSAIPLYELVLDWIGLPSERVVVLANLSRAAGVCRDRLRYERAYQAIESIWLAGHRVPACALYHTAQGCRAFEEWHRALLYCERAIGTARAGGNAFELARAEELRAELDRRLPGDGDILPPEGGEVDELREKLTQKLKSLPPGEHRSTVPPEKYPIER